MAIRNFISNVILDIAKVKLVLYTLFLRIQIRVRYAYTEADVSQLKLLYICHE